MRRALVGIVVASAALAALAGAVLARDGAQASPCRSTLVPAYVSPAELVALAEAPRRPRIAVVNPASGPGAARDPAYADAVVRAREAGMRVLGYVATGYGARPEAEVRADIDRYTQWYGVDGIFLDETAHTAALVAHYRGLAAAARGADGRFVVMNAGVVPARGYFDLADVVVTFEGPVREYAAAVVRAPDWLPAEQVAHLVYAASRSEALAAVRRADVRARWVYVTSGRLPNPWRTLPDYLEEEEALLEGCAA